MSYIYEGDCKTCCRPFRVLHDEPDRKRLPCPVCESPRSVNTVEVVT